MERWDGGRGKLCLATPLCANIQTMEEGKRKRYSEGKPPSSKVQEDNIDNSTQAHQDYAQHNGGPTVREVANQMPQPYFQSLITTKPMC